MIPNGWKSACLGDVASLIAGINKPLSAMGRGTLYLTVQELYVGSHVDPDSLGRIDLTPDEIVRFSLQEGDIVFGKSSVKREGIGYPNRFIGAREAVVHSGFTYAARPNAQLVHDGYLFHVLRSEPSRRWLINNSQASALTNINAQIARAVPVLVPPLAEQRAIAEALTETDALVESLDALIAKKRDMKQAAMQQLLTGRTRLLGGSTEWEFVQVGEIARTLKGRGLSRDVVLETGAHPCLLYGELFTTYKRVARGVGGRTDSIDGEPSKFGDVLIPGSTTTSGEDLATATALLMDGVRLGGDVNIIRPDLQRIDPRWMAYVFTHCHRQDVALRAQGVTIHHLYGRDIASIEMRLPERDEQTRLADVLEDMDAEIDALVAQREKAELVKQGMMQELLSGRVRLV